MVEDLSVQGLTVKDEIRYDRNSGGNVKERVYRFYLGKHGPFEERSAQALTDPNWINGQVIALRTAIQAVS